MTTRTTLSILITLLGLLMLGEYDRIQGCEYFAQFRCVETQLIITPVDTLQTNFEGKASVWQGEIEIYIERPK